MSTERRNNWKSGLGKTARTKAIKTEKLLVSLEEVKSKLQVATSYAEYEQLKKEQREITARLATL